MNGTYQRVAWISIKSIHVKCFTCLTHSMRICLSPRRRCQFNDIFQSVYRMMTLMVKNAIRHRHNHLISILQLNGGATSVHCGAVAGETNWFNTN